MPRTTIELLNKGIRANQTDRYRRGNVVVLPGHGSLVVTGDLHGHRRNFERIVTLADLGAGPDRHVILHEIIHGGPEDEVGGCLSYQLLFEAVRYKIEYPDQVHFVLANHDTACVCGTDVMKNGKEMNRAMAMAVDREFSGAGADVQLAIRQFLISQPLAVRCQNRLWVSHSLPSDRLVDQFDPAVFDRELAMRDLAKPGPAYLLTWGRRHSQGTLDRMAAMLDVDVFVLGHQPQPEGWGKAGDNLIILACDHNHGCVLPVDLSQEYTADELGRRAVPLASIG
jgi:serine/threonine-protein phosphatase PP1 catalytic subunit